MDRGDRLRVAFQGSLSFGGVGTVTRELTRRLAQHASVAVYDVNQFSPNGLTPNDVERTEIYTRSISAGVPFNLLLHAIAFRRFDVAHINYGIFGVSALVSNKFCGIPYVETVHGIPQPELEKGYDRLGYVAEQWALPLTSSNASLVVSDSEYIRSGLRSRFGIESTLIPLGVDLERFHPPTRKEAEVARRKLNIRDDELAVLYVGRLHPWKDPLTLVRATHLLVEDATNVHTFLVGKGSMELPIQRMTKELGIEGRLTVVNDVDYNHGLSDYYLASDIFVLPTKKEGFGLVLLEAMASGLPVIASDGGASPELVGEDGLLFRTSDPESLAIKIQSLCSDQSLRESIGRRARERTMKLFDWQRCADTYLRLYSNITRK